MKQVAVIRNSDIIPGSESKDSSGYPYRESARAVLFNGKKVALIHVTSEAFYKLPGGGVESGETHEQALRREILEETGYQVTNIREVGETLEYKDHKPELQRSFCYTAHTSGDPAVIQLTEEEKAAGIVLVWAATLDQAISLVEKARPESLSARFIQRRESLLLQELLHQT